MPQQLHRELHPRWLADRAVIQATPEHKYIRAVQYLPRRILEVVAGRVQNHDVKIGRAHV